MPIPIAKVLLTSVRICLRPINNMIVSRAKNVRNGQILTEEPKTWPFMYRFFVGFGQYSNRFETAMNRVIIN